MKRRCGGSREKADRRSRSAKLNSLRCLRPVWAIRSAQTSVRMIGASVSEVNAHNADRDNPRPWLRAFWHRAYRENVTGLSAMVAYNLMLAVFPFALLVLFVFGQVLKIERGRGERARRPPAALPQRRAAHADRRAQPDRGQLDHDRDRRLLRLALDRRLLLGGDGHRLLPHLPRRVPRLGRAEALLLRDARRSSCSSSPPASSCRRWRRRWSPAPTGCPSASPTSRRSTRRCCSAPAILIVFADLLRDLLGGAERATCPGARSGRGRPSSPSPPASPTGLFPFYLSNVSSLSRFGSTLGFVLIALLWFYVLSLALLAGAVINSLRHELHDTGEMPYWPRSSPEASEEAAAAAKGALGERLSRSARR